MAVVSRVGFLRWGLILEVLKDAGLRPEVREELMRVVWLTIQDFLRQE